MKIAIVGYGVEGRASYEYWQGHGNELLIVDEREEVPDLPKKASVKLGRDAFANLDDFDLIVRSPGVPPSKLPYGDKVWSATNEFLEKCPAQIIGVTGTKGKGTTASLIASILKNAHKKVHLVGNIGVPALEELHRIRSDHIVVFEMSSFQLWDARKSPQVAVVLMIEPDHLDVHANMRDYVLAKANIRVHQTGDDKCLYHPTNPIAAQIARGATTPASRYGTEDDGQVYAEGGLFYVGDHIIGDVSELRVPGAHNVENATAAISAARLFGADDKAVRKGLMAFEGLPHRLKFVREVGGVSYYDDSIATTPGSAIAALNAFSQPKVLILGGRDKGSDYAPLIEAIAASDSVRAVLCIGESGLLLGGMLQANGITEGLTVVPSGTDMANITQQAQAAAQPGDVVILSPAAASFDMFSSYVDRGVQFVRAVEKLKS